MDYGTYLNECLRELLISVKYDRRDNILPFNFSNLLVIFENKKYNHKKKVNIVSNLEQLSAIS